MGKLEATKNQNSCYVFYLVIIFSVSEIGSHLSLLCGTIKTPGGGNRRLGGGKGKQIGNFSLKKRLDLWN